MSRAREVLVLACTCSCQEASSSPGNGRKRRGGPGLAGWGSLRSEWMLALAIAGRQWWTAGVGWIDEVPAGVLTMQKWVQEPKARRQGFGVVVLDFGFFPGPTLLRASRRSANREQRKEGSFGSGFPQLEGGGDKKRSENKQTPPGGLLHGPDFDFII